MKKYGICLILFLVVSAVCLLAGYGISRGRGRLEPAVPNTVYETETVTEPRLVVNQDFVEPAAQPERYYLVSETGFLLVFAQDQSTICLYTHIPITDFPEEEQARLRAGIWFSSMMDVFHYLESYTS